MLLVSFLLLFFIRSAPWGLAGSFTLLFLARLNGRFVLV